MMLCFTKEKALGDPNSYGSVKSLYKKEEAYMSVCVCVCVCVVMWGSPLDDVIIINK